MTRVAVTTTPDTANKVALSLQAHGLVPIFLPCIAIDPSPARVLARLRSEAATADLILVTSARAVRITWPEGDMPDTPVAAVGAAAAEAVRNAGGKVTLEGTAGAGELVPTIRANGQRIVFPHARAADASTATELEAAGATVIAAPAYDTIPIAPGDATVEAALFGSPSAVEGWTINRHLDGLVVGAMGATTATALRMRGVDDPVVPDRPGFDELAAALAERINS